MPGFAGNVRWVLRLSDDCQYLGGRAYGVETEARIFLWINECRYSIELTGDNYRKSPVDKRVYSSFVCDLNTSMGYLFVSTRCKTTLAEEHRRHQIRAVEQRPNHRPFSVGLLAVHGLLVP